MSQYEHPSDDDSPDDDSEDEDNVGRRQPIFLVDGDDMYELVETGRMNSSSDSSDGYDSITSLNPYPDAHRLRQADLDDRIRNHNYWEERGKEWYI